MLLSVERNFKFKVLKSNTMHYADSSYKMYALWQMFNAMFINAFMVEKVMFMGLLSSRPEAEMIIMR